MISIDRKVKNLTQRELVVFDFDETLVNCNSDTWIHQLAPNKRIPEELEYRHGQDYFKHVQSVLAYLYKEGVRKNDYSECLGSMPTVDFMDTLITTLGKCENKYDMIILSDANSFFIDSYLQAKSLSKYFPTVLTNPAKFTTDGQLIINEFHVQDYCSLSSRNLCKGDALKNYIGKRMLTDNVVYTCINYVGDGENDLCATLKLNVGDRVFPRSDYPLERLCFKLKYDSEVCSVEDVKKLPELKASVVPWTTGEDILNIIVGNCTQV